METEPTLTVDALFSLNVLAIITFVLAVLAGAWRQKWICIEHKADNEFVNALKKLPIWGNKSVRIASWIVVALTSMVSSLIFAFSLKALGLPAWPFFFGVILTIRWMVSGYIGVSLGEKHIAARKKEDAAQSNTVTGENLFEKTDAQGTQGEKSGESIEEAIILDAKNEDEGVSKEYEYVESKFGVYGVDWQRGSQSLMEVDGKTYDEISLDFPDGSSKKIYFDITSWYGRSVFTEGKKMKKSVSWESLFKDIEQNDPEKPKEFWQIVTSFLIPHNISPSKFRGNSVTLVFPEGLPKYRTNNPLFARPGRFLFLVGDPENANPTPSLAKFLYLAGAALPFDDLAVRAFREPRELLTMWASGYPEWYVAAYPDVVIWAGDQFSTRVSRNLPFTENPLAWEHIREYMLSSKAKGASHKKFDENLFRNVFGNISSKNELMDDDRLIKHRHLRVLIEAYRKKTGHTLECST